MTRDLIQQKITSVVELLLMQGTAEMSDIPKDLNKIHVGGAGELRLANRIKPPLQIEGRSIFAEWDNISFDNQGIKWDAPSSFIIYTDGLWALSARALANFFNGYGYFDQHFSVRWWFYAEYYNQEGKAIYSNTYPAGNEGYDSSAQNVIRPRPGDQPIDLGFQQRADIIKSAKGAPRFESYYS